MKKSIKVIMILNLVTMFIISPVSAKTINASNNYNYSTAKIVGLNDTIKGKINRYDEDNEHYYKITIPKSSSYRIKMDVKVIGEYLGMTIYNSKGESVNTYWFNNNNGLGFRVFTLNLYFDPGIYYLEVDNYEWLGNRDVNYQITLKNTRMNNIDYNSNISMGKATTLKLNKKYTAVSSIFNSYSTYGTNEDEYFKFKLSGKKKIKIVISSSYGHLFTLYDSKGKEVEYTRSNSIQKTLKKGTYYLTADITDPNSPEIGGVWNSFGGKYTITLVEVPSTVNLSSTKSNAKKKLTVKYKKVSGASGYRIYYKKQGSKKWYSKYTTKTSYTLSKLSRKKYYSVKVRAYKTVGGVKHYGAYSKTKKAKVK